MRSNSRTLFPNLSDSTDRCRAPWTQQALIGRKRPARSFSVCGALDPDASGPSSPQLSGTPAQMEAVGQHRFNA